MRGSINRFRPAFASAMILGLCGAPWTAGRAQTTPQGPSAAEPHIAPGPQIKPGSPVVESLVGSGQPDLEVHRRIARSHRLHDATTEHARHRTRRVHYRAAPLDLERPALAGVELLTPVPRPGEPPHIEVPLPAYPLDSIATAFLTPAPPVVCHRVRREPGLPDPHLYREVTLACEPDNP